MEGCGTFGCAGCLACERAAVARWFVAAERFERRRFLSALLSRVVPPAACDGGLAAAMQASLAVAPRAPTAVGQALAAFDRWPHEHQNALLNALEDIDAVCVNEFHDSAARLRWR
eukprot:Opistho-1_new@18065